jgi:hypothetical protein
MIATVRANGWRQPRAGGLARRSQVGNALERIPTRKIAAIQASRLHAVLGARLTDGVVAGRQSGIVPAAIPRFVKRHVLPWLERYAPTIAVSCRRMRYETECCTEVLDGKWPNDDTTVIHSA